MIEITTPTGASFPAILADRFFSRFLGLMGRDLKQGDALLLSPCNQIHCFFMKSAIDVAYLAKTGEILALTSSMPRWSVGSTVKGAAKVLELYPGDATRLGLSVGQILRVGVNDMGRSEGSVLSGAITELREQLDAETRFKKVLMGYDPGQVNALLKAQKDFITRLQAEQNQVRQGAEQEVAAARAEQEQEVQAARAEQEREVEAARAEQEREVEAARAEQEREVEAARAEQEKVVQELQLLRESVELHQLEKLRAQLLAATRECSESTVQLAAARQELKGLKARMEVLAAEHAAATSALEEERERCQIKLLAADRALARSKSGAHQLAAETAQRLRETAELVTTSFAEYEITFPS